MIAFPEETDSDLREARAHQVVGACGALADVACELTRKEFPRIPAARMAHLHRVVTAAGVAAATLSLAALPIPAEEGERLARIVTDSLDESDKRTLALVDDCVLTIEAAVAALGQPGPPMTDPMLTFRSALGDWVANNAFGRSAISLRKVVFAQHVGRSLVRPISDVWMDRL